MEEQKAKEVTITLTKDNFKPRIAFLWDIVDYAGRTGIVYRIARTVDEDGEGITLSIKGWKISKYRFINWLRLTWLKIKVKFNWI